MPAGTVPSDWRLKVLQGQGEQYALYVVHRIAKDVPASVQPYPIQAPLPSKQEQYPKRQQIGSSQLFLCAPHRTRETFVPAKGKENKNKARNVEVNKDKKNKEEKAYQ